MTSSACVLSAVLANGDVFEIIFFIIVAIIWAFGALIKWFSQVIKKAQERQAEHAPRREYPPAPAAPREEPVIPYEFNEPPISTPAPAAQPEAGVNEAVREIAELMLGVDLGELQKKPAPPRPAMREPQAPPPPAPMYQENEAPKPRVSEILEQRARSQRLREAQLRRHTTGVQQPSRKCVRLGLGDLRTAFLMKEVFGPPRARQSLQQGRMR
ncbi:hypothetical protein JXA32_10760 [Candidatus Sumerlaeota bacterium]|nr:hypothetical protein [Candidatus Sumerlaeota bacterium]